MKTPICDFVNRYQKSGALRLHMPGHKGQSLLGMEQLDITEIAGADSLYEACGIIAQSEENASALFGAQTFYSTEGSSHCIRAMLHLTALYAKQQNKRLAIAAAGNVHKTFIGAAALLELEVLWLPARQQSYLCCHLEMRALDSFLREEKPVALYLTSPDYLGNLQDISAVAEICHKYDVLLLTDNAHGAYLRFLQPSQHPIDLGADLCCSSAHKTLPVLTGGAYLHIGAAAPGIFREQAKNALSLFGSTSPSYLILQSLDAANRYLAEGYSQKLADFITRLQRRRDRLRAHGYCLLGQEPLKLTIACKPYGYTGTQLANLLAGQGIVCEFADPDFLVLMLTAELSEAALDRMEQALESIPQKPALTKQPPAYHRCAPVMSIREAMLAPCETLPVENCIGRVLAAPSVGCPPAVPIVVCGERIDEAAAACFRYYGIESCAVVKN
jgi:arginine/lysine/ornithine decarboxylase